MTGYSGQFLKQSTIFESIFFSTALQVKLLGPHIIRSSYVRFEEALEVIHTDIPWCHHGVGRVRIPSPTRLQSQNAEAPHNKTAQC